MTQQTEAEGFRHGTAYGYVRHGCHCAICTEAYKTKTRQWKENKAARRRGEEAPPALPRHVWRNPETGEVECLMCIDIGHLLCAGEAVARIAARLGLKRVDSLLHHAMRHDPDMLIRLRRRSELDRAKDRGSL